MNLEETGKLLAVIAVNDNRKLDRFVAAVWHDDLRDLDYLDCLQAVKQHRRERPDVYLNSGHVYQGAVAAAVDREKAEAWKAAEARRAERDMFAITRTEEPPPPRDPDELARLKAELRAKIPAGNPAKLHPRRAQWDRVRRTGSDAGVLKTHGLRLVVDSAPDQAEAS